MLQAMRNKMHGWPSIIVLGLAVLAMSLFGMESYFMSNDDAFVAKVGKHEIDQRAFQDRVNQLRQQAAEQLCLPGAQRMPLAPAEECAVTMWLVAHLNGCRPDRSEAETRIHHPAHRDRTVCTMDPGSPFGRPG